MNHAIEELKSIPGVIGACIYDTKGGVKENNLPSVFKAAKLEEIGKLLLKVYNTGRMNFSDIMEVSIYYEESVVIIREATKTIFLIVFCDPSINLNLITMTMNLLMEDLAATESGAIETKEEEPEENIQPMPPPDEEDENSPDEDLSPEELLNSSLISDSLNNMQSALVRLLGPMAKIIFMDALADWSEENKPNHVNLPKLVDILSEEIDDPDKVQEYRKMIEPYI